MLESFRCSIVICALLGCSVDTAPRLDPRRGDSGLLDAGSDGGGMDADLPDGDVDGDVIEAGQDDPSLLEAPPAPERGNVTLDEALDDIVVLGDLVLGLHSASGASLLDFEDPSAPSVITFLPTAGTVVDAAYDAQRQIVLTLTERGDLRAYRMFDRSAPSRIAQLDAVEPSSSMFQGFARVGNRLFLLGRRSIVPVDVIFGADGSATFTALAEVAIGEGAQRIAAGGPGLYVGFEGGIVRAFTAVSAPVAVGEFDLGAEIVDWVVSGQRITVALEGIGVRMLVLRAGGRINQLFEVLLTDVIGLERTGQLMLLTLERGLLLAIDIAMPDAPRTLVLHEASAPGWVALVFGDLTLGSERSITVLGVPPIVHEGVPSAIADELPSHARIPLVFSKPLAPASVTAGTFTLHCDDAPIDSTASLAPDGRTVVVVPEEPLASGASCRVGMEQVRDRFGLPASAAEGLLELTVSDAPSLVRNADSAHEHDVDGRFTAWSSGADESYEYADIDPALGMLGRVHVDHDGSRLWVLADFVHGQESLAADCYGVVQLLAENDHWEARLFGDERVEVRRNGSLLGGNDEQLLAGYAFGATPFEAQPHTVYEVGIELEPGAFSLAVAGPGTVGCAERQLDPVVLDGSTASAGTSVEPSPLPDPPPTPSGLAPVGTIGSLTPTLTWMANTPPSLFTSYEVEVATAGTEPQLVYRAAASLPMLELPAGALVRNASYVFRVTAHNLLGSATSPPAAFSTTATEVPDAPELDSVEPSRVGQGESATLTLSGEGFVSTATVFIEGVALSTTFVAENEVEAVLPAAFTALSGTASIVVRNLAADDTTESNALDFVVVEPCEHGECLPGAALEDACSGCVSAICAAEPECCSEQWSSTCIAAAAVSPSCTCSAPALVGLSVVSGTEGTDTPLSVELQDAPSGYDYALVLTLDGSDAAVLPCAYVEGDPPTCDATVPGSLPAGTYAASMRVGLGAVVYETSSTADAFEQNP